MWSLLLCTITFNKLAPFYYVLFKINCGFVVVKLVSDKPVRSLESEVIIRNI